MSSYEFPLSCDDFRKEEFEVYRYMLYMYRCGWRKFCTLPPLSALFEIIISHFEEVLIDAVQIVLYIISQTARKAKNNLLHIIHASLN